MYGIQVERMAGRSDMGHYFPHCVSLMKSNGQPIELEDRRVAEKVAQTYRDSINQYTICKKIYTVVEL